MRLHRFYIADKIDGGKIGSQITLTIDSADLVNQIRRVFRLKNGDSVILFDGSGFDYECEVAGDESKIGGDLGVHGHGNKTHHKNSISFRVTSSERSHYMPARDIYLCAAITKKDTFEWIVEKATELGVTHIIPVLAERSEKKSLNEERLRKIVVEASEQSGRGCVPLIHQIKNLSEAFVAVKNIQSVVFHTEAELFSKDELKEKGDANLADSSPLAVFIGPEGGWSPDEIDMFHTLKVPVRSLGNQVLRAETAVIAALSRVVFTNK